MQPCTKGPGHSNGKGSIPAQVALHVLKGHRIDLAFDSYRLANTKGRKTVKAWILQ